ncbi:transposase [Georgenia yuyongxinii]
MASVPALSLEPVFRRSHGSLYKALAHGQVDEGAMRDLLAAHRPQDWPLVFAVDATTWPRCDAETSPGRGFYYSASTHSAGQPIVAGWSYQHLVQLGWAKDSWTAPVDVRRLHPQGDATGSTVEQVTDLVDRLGPTDQVPIIAFDAGYGNDNPIWPHCAGLIWPHPRTCSAGCRGGEGRLVEEVSVRLGGGWVQVVARLPSSRRWRVAGRRWCRC